MEEKQLVIRSKDIFSKIRIFLITLFKKQESLKNTQNIRNGKYARCNGRLQM